MNEEFIFEDQRSMRLTHYVMAERLMQVEAYKIMEEYRSNNEYCGTGFHVRRWFQRLSQLY